MYSAYTICKISQPQHNGNFAKQHSLFCKCSHPILKTFKLTLKMSLITAFIWAIYFPHTALPQLTLIYAEDFPWSNVGGSRLFSQQRLLQGNFPLGKVLLLCLLTHCGALPLQSSIIPELNLKLMQEDHRRKDSLAFSCSYFCAVELIISVSSYLNFGDKQMALLLISSHYSSIHIHMMQSKGLLTILHSHPPTCLQRERDKYKHRHIPHPRRPDW